MLLLYPLVVLSYNNNIVIDPIAITYSDLKLSFNQTEDNILISLHKSCPGIFLETEYEKEIYTSVSDPIITVPMPNNVKQNQLIPTDNISVLISGNNRNSYNEFPEIHKIVCLNHLAFAYAHGVLAYGFLHAYTFKEALADLPPHWLKVIALKTLLPQIEPNKWIMWADDDVVTSDFHTMETSSIDTLINTFAGEEILKRPSVLVSSDPYTGINTGIVLIRNSKEGRAFLEHWWETRVDDIDKPYYCDKTGNSFETFHFCLDDCRYIETGNPSCSVPGNPNVNVNVFIFHEQETLYRMIMHPETESHKESTNAMRYLGSHIIKIFPQKHQDRQYDNNNFIGINTFFVERNLKIEAKAIHPRRDVWVHTPGFGANSEKRFSYLSTWLSKINYLYPYKNKKYEWQKTCFIIDSDSCSNSDIIFH